MLIVDLLESIQIDQHQADRSAMTLLSAQFFREQFKGRGSIV